MKVHKVEVLIVDHDDIGSEEVRVVLENQKYPNWCMSPIVQAIETREVKWSDDHPLNRRETADAAYRALFAVADGE